MNVEIVEFYPIEWKKERESLTGTLRIKLSDIGIHILGVFVSKRNGSWFFALPGRQGFDHEAGKKIRYPCIVFEDRDNQKELIEAIKEKAPAFIEMRLADTENPLKFPERLQKENPSTKNTKKII